MARIAPPALVLLAATASVAGLSAPALAQSGQQPSRSAPAAESRPQASDRQALSSNVYYPNCDAARAAGAAPLRRGQPGYRPPLDRDGDGVACEPYRRR